MPQERANERVWELVYYRSQDLITSDRFVELVKIVDFVPARRGGYDGYAPGTFDIIRQAFLDGVLTDQEYEQIAVEAPEDVVDDG